LIPVKESPGTDGVIFGVYLPVGLARALCPGFFCETVLCGLLERLAFNRSHAIRSDHLNSHVRQAEDRFPLLRDLL